MKKPVIILGAGGHAKVLIDTLKRNEVPIKGITVPNPSESPSAFVGVPIIGNDDKVLEFLPKEIDLINGIGSVGSNKIRKGIFEYFHGLGYYFPPLIHPAAFVASDVTIHEGVQIMAGAVIQPDTEIFYNTIINTMSSIDHDCRIGNHVHIAPGVTVSGSVVIEDDVHVGTGAKVINGVEIGKGSLIAAGAVVIKNINKGVKVIGIPGREVTL